MEISISLLSLFSVVSFTLLDVIYSREPFQKESWKGPNHAAAVEVHGEGVVKCIHLSKATAFGLFSILCLWSTKYVVRNNSRQYSSSILQGHQTQTRQK